MPVTLPGNNTAYIDVGDAVNLAQAYPFTLYFRFRLTDKVSTWQVMSQGNNDGVAGAGWYVEIGNTGAGGQFRIGSATGGEALGPIPSAGIWYTGIIVAKASTQQYFFLYDHSANTLTTSSTTANLGTQAAPTSGNHTVIGVQQGTAGTFYVGYKGDIAAAAVFPGVDKSQGGVITSQIWDFIKNGFWNQLDGNCSLAATFTGTTRDWSRFGRKLSNVGSVAYTVAPQIVEFRPAPSFIWLPAAAGGTTFTLQGDMRGQGSEQTTPHLEYDV
jgi:hypothetical protein